MLKFDELYQLMLENVKQECTFNKIGITSDFFHDLDHLVTATQCAESSPKLIITPLAPSVVPVEMNHIGELTKTMEAMVFAIIMASP